MTLDAMLTPPEPESAVTVTPSKPRRHRHIWQALDVDATSARITLGTCTICGTPYDPAASRRGRNNRSRGLAKQRANNRILGITNIAGNAPNHDGGKHDELFASESKSGGAFSERYWRWLTHVPTLAGQIPVLIVADAPGPGHPTRRMVIVRAEDWRDLHGGEA